MKITQALKNIRNPFNESHFWIGLLALSIGIFAPSVKVLTAYLVIGAVLVYIKHAFLKYDLKKNNRMIVGFDIGHPGGDRRGAPIDLSERFIRTPVNSRIRNGQIVHIADRDSTPARR